MILSILMAVTAYSLLSLGFVLQKKGIQWMGWKGTKDKIFYSNLITWIMGFVIMNVFPIPSAIALKNLPPHIVSAFAGWGIIMLVFFSFLLLKEKLYKTDYIFSLLVVAGIVLLNYFEKSTGSVSSIPTLRVWGLVILCAVPVILIFPGLLKFLSKKVKTWVFASVSGMCAGLMVITLRLLVVNFGYEVSSYLDSIYLYLYLGSALLSFIGLQLALKNGPMIAVGPVQYSTTIIYPVFAAFLVFQQAIHPVQVLAIALIVYSVINILKNPMAWPHGMGDL
jgi:drug/metabolite transporter (DMT)-like permease